MDQQMNDKKANKNQTQKINSIRIGAVAIVLGISTLSLVLLGNSKRIDNRDGFADTATMADIPAVKFMVPKERTMSPGQSEQEEVLLEKEAVLAEYQNLGIVRVSGNVNMREAPGTDQDIVGEIYDGSACEILEETADGWYKIASGGFEGYISKEFVLTGADAQTKAMELVELQAVISADSLNVRKKPSTESEPVGTVRQNERYAVKSQTDGWIEIDTGYIAADYAVVRYGLNEARKLNLKELVVNLYDNLGISNVSNYLNIRETPSEDGTIIGKLPSQSAGNILEEADGWYKIQSGPVTGYVKKEYILTGNDAKSAAVQAAKLMIKVDTETLNVRTEPTTDASIWTQLANGETFLVVSQTDGWAEIEMDTASGFVSTDYVEVFYGLDEAIKFTPLVERNDSGSASNGNTGSGKTAGGSVGASASSTSSKRLQIVNYALQFVGNPYKWGGSSLTNGADCSGFALSVFKNFGISLPRTSGSQASAGRSVSSGQMRPGDLIFYANSSGTVNHVAIYIGNGQVVHASSAKTGIKISTWNYRNYVKIVNVIGD